ncbi:carbohydrate ABC transporter permease [Micromonospora chalcea]|uniref:Sugar ABC transporter permease n=1 Tax=Micromonospora chalcea TaxID=1874 RepID=A0ABX9Y0S6_MICCH|nr:MULTISPECIES: sugar ABC transporter permease [Micromonospora]MBP1784392.1 N-acetylglucosamine transport system permease protein [Micromonospora sp. HB375]MBQ1069905.1 sugar ABC transporter permease [Micromonospora sp. D75]MCT2278282.1 sugar ABC transporter permease [Micromonospora chalcea]MDH6470984.1 N-acetylglucosamine transport system permease protein [Micromonospora sp. H404/HB375]NHO84058.1 sugar ABC transporter permease [Micromonospora sp. CMU55-4]
MRQGRLPLILTFLLPPLALYGIFVLSPYLQAFQISTTDWMGYSAQADPVGMANFRTLLNDGYVWNALKNNAILLAVVPVVTIGLGLFFASMLTMGGRRGRAGVTGVRGTSVYRLVYFFPQVLSVVIIALLWKEIYSPTSGLLNGALRAVGLATPAWLGDPRFAFWCVLAVMVWSNVGFYVVLFGAAMQAIPRDIYEAVLLDGASRTTMLRKITIPLLWDTIQVAWIYLAIAALDGFILVQLMTNGGPNFSSDVIGLRMYDTSFGSENKFGYASAIGVAMFFLTLSVAVLALRTARRDRIEYS